jgi:glycosyltransferase involved in cell wall biosynthesis
MDTARPRVSVILCTYNPRPDLLQWAISSVERQTLAAEDFEFVIVDNRSDPPLDTRVLEEGRRLGLRVIREAAPGLTRARVAGIRATSAPLIAFLDDDNYLEADYLQEALSIAAANPWIGCFGGKSRAVFECRVPAWKHKLLGYVGVRDYGPHAITSNRDCWGEWEPIGAGLVCRRDVAEAFAERVTANPEAARLGRTGGGLMSGEDTLIAQTAYRLKYSCSYQPALELSHWMKAPRLTLPVLARTVAGHGRSYVVLQRLKGSPVPRPRAWEVVSTLVRRYLDRVWATGIGVGSVEWFWDIGYFYEARRPQ